jgi:hypothetical protein
MTRTEGDDSAPSYKTSGKYVEGEGAANLGYIISRNQ